MWIPKRNQPTDHDIRLAVITSAQALGAALGEKAILLKVYQKLMEHAGNNLSVSMKVCTDSYEGDGIQLTPVEAYHLDNLGPLGEEQVLSRGGYGRTDYSRHFSWRDLNVAALYDYLSDKTLPQPNLEDVSVSEE